MFLITWGALSLATNKALHIVEIPTVAAPAHEYTRRFFFLIETFRD